MTRRICLRFHNKSGQVRLSQEILKLSFYCSTYSHFSELFGNKQNTVWCQIDQRNVITILFFNSQELEKISLCVVAIKKKSRNYSYKIHVWKLTKVYGETAECLTYFLRAVPYSQSPEKKKLTSAVRDYKGPIYTPQCDNAVMVWFQVGPHDVERRQSLEQLYVSSMMFFH